ncbi:hypothetical protein HGRIS_012326 [Hohenbuehelia grisea]|uniref:Uncharacterized protein n=1 Tax=Hohenbuehelia grisea TaxID=104357 RepID=A0ABR3IRY3_9AGAR
MDAMEPRSRTPDDALPERASLSIETLDQRLQHVLAQQERYPSIDSRITAQTPHSPVSTDIPTESDHAADPPSPDSPSLEYLTPPEYPSDDNSHSNQTSTSQVLLLSTMPTDTVPDEVNNQRGSVTAGPMLPRTRIFDIGPLDHMTPFSHLGYGPEFELSYATSTERARIAEGHTPRIRPGVLTSGQTQVISRLRSEDGTERLELNMLNANVLLQNTDSRVLASFPCHAHITAIIPPEDMDTTFPFEAPMIAQEALHAALVEAGNTMSRILDDPDTDTEAVEEHQPSDEPLTPPGMTPLPDEPHIDLAPTPRSTYVNVLTTTPESQVSSLPYIHSPSAIRRHAHAHPVRHEFIPPTQYFPYETTLMAQQIPAHAPLDPIFVHPLAAADPAAEHQGLPVAGDLEEILAQREVESNEQQSTGLPVPMRVVSRREQELLSCQQRYAQEHHDRLPIYQTPEPRTRRTLSSYNYRSRSESPRLSLGRGPRSVSVSSESDSDMDTQTQTVPPFDDSVTPGPALASINKKEKKMEKEMKMKKKKKAYTPPHPASRPKRTPSPFLSYAEPIIVEYAPPPRYSPYPGQTSDIPDNIFIYRHPGGSNSTLWLPSPIVKGRATDDLEPGCYGEDDEMDAAGHAKITPSNYPPPPPDTTSLQQPRTLTQPYAGLATISRETFQDSPDPSTNPFTASTRSAPATPEMVVEARRLVTTPPVRNRDEDRPAGPELVRPPTPFPMSGGRLFRGGHTTRDPDIVAPTASHRPLLSAPVPNDMGRVSEVSLLTSYVIRCLTEACALMNKIVTTERADAQREDVGLFHFQQQFIETHDINPPHHKLWFAYDDILQHIGRNSDPRLGLDPPTRVLAAGWLAH